jgi:hypothetical protein
MTCPSGSGLSSGVARISPLDVRLGWILDRGRSATMWISRLGMEKGGWVGYLLLSNRSSHFTNSRGTAI